jgi:predicted SAM-dependent methyltransferase
MNNTTVKFFGMRGFKMANTMNDIVIPEHTKLNMGCGFKKLDDHWNVDIEKKCNPDQVLNFEITPWPYEDNFFDHITADNILEHLGQNPNVFTNIIKEMYRVSADGAEWYINVPHHRCDLFWDDYTHVRVLSAKTFKMFDQKVNYESIERKLSDSTYGIYHSVDLEVYDVSYNMVDYWKQQVSSGMLGSTQLDINLNTMSNVAESVNIFIKVHKPGRFEYLTNKV